MNAADRRQLVEWARRAMHGLDESTCFIGVLDDHPLTATRVEFTLQLGHAVLLDKPIIIPVPFGVDVPAKLAAVADRIVRYDPADPDTLTENLAVALTELGINRQ